LNKNPAIKKLGFSEQDRVVIIHTDDIGMCQASVSAFIDLWDYGLISSGATMVPCPWFLETAKYCRDNLTVDMGVHLTLTSEWETFRWGPISTREEGSGLIDEEGFFYRSSEEVQKHGHIESVKREIQSQIDRAISSAIQPTHIDTHMGSVGSLKFIPSYLGLAFQYKLPVMVMRLDKSGWMDIGFDEVTANLAVGMVHQFEEAGLPLVDRIAGLDLDRVDNPIERIGYAKKVFSELDPGITHFIIHPSKDTPELRAITSGWSYRVADYLAFQSDELRNFTKETGIQIIGYQDLKDLM
jgi:predicted glycoside hydrolase/deacetylase ChbG (UPF0249 family)